MRNINASVTADTNMPFQVMTRTDTPCSNPNNLGRMHLLNLVTFLIRTTATPLNIHLNIQKSWIPIRNTFLSSDWLLSHPILTSRHIWQFPEVQVSNRSDFLWALQGSTQLLRAENADMGLIKTGIPGHYQQSTSSITIFLVYC